VTASRFSDLSTGFFLGAFLGVVGTTVLLRVPARLATAEAIDLAHADLTAQITALAGQRCMTVQTASVTIYHTPNLGVVPVPGKGKP
jgi:hypothetical protein